MAKKQGAIEIEGTVVERLINRAVLKIWDKYLTVEGCERITAHFEAGWGVEVSDRMRADEYQEGLRQIHGHEVPAEVLDRMIRQ